MKRSKSDDDNYDACDNIYFIINFTNNGQNRH